MISINSSLTDPTDIPVNPTRAPSKRIPTGSAKLLDPNNTTAPELSSHQNIQLAEKQRLRIQAADAAAFFAADSTRNHALAAPTQPLLAASSFLAPDNPRVNSRSQSPGAKRNADAASLGDASDAEPQIVISTRAKATGKAKGKGELDLNELILHY